MANVRKMRSWSSGSIGVARGRVDRLRRAQLLHRRRASAQGRFRARGGQEPRLEARVGHRREQRPLLPHRRRGCEDGDRGRRQPYPLELLYRDLRQEADERILTLTMNLADPSPGWAGGGSSAGRCPIAAARPGAGARAGRRRGHLGQCAGQGVRGLAGLAGHGARDRVPDARGPDGEAAPRAKRTAYIPTTSSDSSSAPYRGLRSRALRAPRVGHARPVLRATERG